MSRLIERLRWRIAMLLDKLPGQCWADLVGFALDGGSPWQPQGYSCRKDLNDVGACYCGKLRAPETSVHTGETK